MSKKYTLPNKDLTDTNSVKSHYQNLLKKFGDSYKSAQYSSKESQYRRFKFLTEIADIQNTVILDYGCGTGELLEYFNSQGICVQDYIGVDIVPEFLQIARSKFPTHKFIESPETINFKYDYAFVSGVFNNRIKDNKLFWQKTIAKLYDSCRFGVAFNLMSNYVDYFDSELFYESPEDVFRYIKSNISPYVCLRHDFETNPGTIPFEFVVYIYRKSQS